MTESANQTGDETASTAVDAPRPGAAPADVDHLIDLGLDLGLAPREFKRAPDLSLLKPAPRISAAWLIVPCLACDGLMMPVLTSLNGLPHALGMAIGLSIVGCVLSQGTLLAGWLAWSEGPFLWRLATHWKIAAGLYFVWLVGFGLVLARHGGVPPHFAATVALGVPLVSIAAQLPLWIARQWFGWRLIREQAGPAPLEPPLAIRDLMLATVVLAVSMALARLAPADGQDVWPVWAVSFAIASVISSITLLPAGVLLLRAPVVSRGIAWSCLYVLGWIALPWIIVAVVWTYGLAMLPPLALFVGLSSLMFTFAATLMLTAVIARDRGYRLTGRRKVGPSGP